MSGRKLVKKLDKASLYKFDIHKKLQCLAVLEKGYYNIKVRQKDIHMNLKTHYFSLYILTKCLCKALLL